MAHARVPAAVFWMFTAFFAVCLANVGTLLTRIYDKDVAINPTIFAVAFVLIMPWTKPRPGFTYLTFGWIFTLAFTLLGVLGPHRMVNFDDYALGQIILKLWISVVGVPWLMLRAVDRGRLPTLVRAATLVASLGAVLSAVQVVYPRLLPVIVAEPGRGSGFWVDPNSCGSVCGLFVFASFLFPFRSKSLNLLLRMLLITGIICTLSRGGVVGLAVGAVVYGIVSKRFKALLMVAAGVALFLLTSSFVLQYVGGQSERLKIRADRVQGIIRGNIAENASARTEIWKHGFEAVKKDWLIGRGHGAMARVVPIGNGLGPHNYYLYVWGNSGIVTLVTFLLLLLALFRYGIRAGDKRMKAAITAMSVMLATYAMVDHAFVAHQFMGPLLALVSVVGHYAQEPKKPRSAARPVAPLRR